MGEVAQLSVYVLAKDVGIAPCPDDGVLTSCTCKPRIRAGAGIGDWVLATLPKRFGIGRVAYVGHVAEAIPTGDFAERWPGRADALYRGGAAGQLVHRGGAYHAASDLRKRDLSVRRCLRFEPFWYFGGLGPELSERLTEPCHYRQGQATRTLEGERLEEFRGWLAKWPPGVLGEPREKEEGERWRGDMPYLRRVVDPGGGSPQTDGPPVPPAMPPSRCGGRTRRAVAPRRRSC